MSRRADLEAQKAAAHTERARAEEMLTDIRARLAHRRAVLTEALVLDLDCARRTAVEQSARIAELDAELLREESAAILAVRSESDSQVERATRSREVFISFNFDASVSSFPSGPSVALARACEWMNVAEVFVSPRIAREELGDILENLRRFEREGRPCWHLYVHAALGIALALWHTWGDKIAALRKRSG